MGSSGSIWSMDFSFALILIALIKCEMMHNWKDKLDTIFILSIRMMVYVNETGEEHLVGLLFLRILIMADDDDDDN